MTKKLAYITGALVAVGAIAYLAYYLVGFFVTSTVPKNGAGKVNVASPVRIKFNRALSPQTLKSFSISPRVQGKLRLEGKQVVFEPEDTYVIGTTYTVRLDRPLSADGKLGGPVSLSFTARFVEFKDIPRDQQQQQIEQSDSLEREFPIVKFIPRETAEYKIDYELDGNNRLVLKIDLYATLNRPSQLKVYNQQLAAYKKAALDYIRSRGENPAKYQIQYTPPEAKDL